MSLVYLPVGDVQHERDCEYEDEHGDSDERQRCAASRPTPRFSSRSVMSPDNRSSLQPRSVAPRSSRIVALPTMGVAGTGPS